MIRLYLSELVKIQPFSTETLSGGKAFVNHYAHCASSVRIVTGLEFSLIGILFYWKNGMKESTMIISLNCLLKGPT
jgi:hypothetical protein